MNNLDNQTKNKKLDSKNIANSIGALPFQIEQVLKNANKIKLPKKYRQINKIFISGMGGSNLGSHIIKSVFLDKIKIPLIIYSDYNIPALVDKNTLVIISSYSGNTEEVLSTYHKAKKTKAKIIAITTGGKLGKIIKKDNLPAFIFNDIHNPSNIPRIGLGYSIVGIYVLLSKVGLIKMDKKIFDKIIINLNKQNKRINLSVQTSQNVAKKLAKKIYKKEIILVGAEFLTGNIRTLRNQFCETGKNFSSFLLLPDLNHFALEGLTHPKNSTKNFIFFFIDSNLYDKKIQKRSRLTKNVIKKNKIKIINYQLKTKTKLEQSFELLLLGTWLSYYLALLNNIDPSITPLVEWFKKQLKNKNSIS